MMTDWETSAGPDGNGGVEWAVCLPGGGDIIATIEPGPQAEAVCNLMATAPQLLAELEAIEALPVDDYGYREIPPGFLDAARAAIARARGE